MVARGSMSAVYKLLRERFGRAAFQAGQEELVARLLAGGEVMPEFIQDAATPENLARATQDFLADPARREAYRRQCAEVVAKLGEPGASRRAAAAITALLPRA